MAAFVTVEASGPGATIQDRGRFGSLRFGVTAAGPMDWVAHETANRALGNPAEAATIEIGPGGIALRAETQTPLAFAGGGFTWSRGASGLPSAARVLLRPGELLRARAGLWGTFAYCAMPGGIDVPVVMGSRSTHLRSALGGLHGRALRAGDRLAPLRVDEGHEATEVTIDAAWLAPSTTAVRIILGPQDDYFSAETIQAFLAGRYRLTAAADRMAYRFKGTPLAHAGDFNIVSDAVAQGAIQVAGDGQPIVLMSDRQPTGGYAKIATICRADIGRLAQLRPGDVCRFAATDLAAARATLLALEDRVATTVACLVPLRRQPTTENLLSVNLVGGVTDGSEERL